MTIDQLDVLDLQCVVMLAETLNFTETAKRLFMTQPDITARINRVEKYLGYRLFDRNKGVVKAITPEGFVFVEEARRVLEDLQRLIARSDEAHRAFSERLSASGQVMSICSCSPSWLQRKQSRACASHSSSPATRMRKPSQCF